MLIDERWVYGVHTFDASGLSDKEVKAKMFDLDRTGYKAHIIEHERGKIKCVISAKEKGSYLVDGVSQYLSTLEALENINANNWVYVEGHGDKHLIIIVKDGTVLLDNIVDLDDYETIYAISTINAELSNDDFSIVLADSSDIDGLISKLGEDDEEQVAANIRLKATIVEPFVTAITPTQNHQKFVNTLNVQFKKKIDKKPIVAAGVFLFAAAGFLLAPEEEKVAETPTVVKAPYEDLNKVMTQTGANVKVRMSYLFNDITALDKLLSWEVAKIDLKPNDTIIYLDHQTNGSYKELERFSYDLNYNISKIKYNYVLIGRIKHSPILRESVLVPADGVIRYIEEGLRDWVNGAKVEKVSNPISNGKWQEIAFSISLGKGLHKHDFDTLGTIINGLPVAFKSGELVYSPKGEHFTGNLEFIVYGGV